jgi:hypothetical protein
MNHEMNPEQTPEQEKGKNRSTKKLHDDDEMKPLQICAPCARSPPRRNATTQEQKRSKDVHSLCVIHADDLGRDTILINEQDYISMTLRKLLLPILSSALRPLQPMHRLSLSLSCSQRGCIRMNGTMADEYGSLDSMGETYITNNFQLEHGEILESAQVSYLAHVSIWADFHYSFHRF